MLRKEYFEYREGPDSLLKRFIITFNEEERTNTKKKKSLKPTNTLRSDLEKAILASTVLEHYKNYINLGDTNDQEPYHFKDISLTYMELIAKLYINKQKQTNYTENSLSVKSTRVTLSDDIWKAEVEIANSVKILCKKI